MRSEALELRVRAARYRKLGYLVGDDQTKAALGRYAAELLARADAIEASAEQDAEPADRKRRSQMQ
ncbi:MAG TPA: hypothetical protein VGR91_02705 [Stellaceae bacterium]|nr:hypothetical protein [Stellaceae bacterium]